MNKLGMAVCLALMCSGCAPQNNPIIETPIALEQSSIRTFDDPKGLYTILIRQKKYIHYAKQGPESYLCDYIVTLRSPLLQTAGNVLISFSDKSGYEVTRRSLGRISKGYTGDLKGTFAMTKEDWNKITQAELVFYVTRREEPVSVEIEMKTEKPKEAPHETH